MSEPLAEASVLIKPDTTRFRAELEAKLNAIKIAPIAVPITAVGAGLAGAAAATSSLVAAQSVAEKSTLGLAGAAQVENSALGKQAVILQTVTDATVRQAGAQAVLDAANKRSAAGLLGAGTATARLNAGLLGLRTAVGSSAVIGLGALALGAIVAGKAIRASITNFAAFQQELSTFRVVATASAEQMKAVADEATRLGEDVRLPAVSASDAAVAMTELAKAGLSVEDSIAGARGVLELATAAQISNGEAALIAANALNSFGLAGDQASRVADDLANAANAAQGSIADFGQAFAQASAVARQVGLSLEDTTALLSLFAKNGLQGSDAGTSLRVALIKLVAPTKAAGEEIQKLGLHIRDAQGNVRPDVFAQFGEATRDLAPSVRDAAAALIFGQDAIRAVSIGAREGEHGLRLMQFQIDQTGTASQVAAARTEGLAGSFSALESNAQTLSITFGRFASGPLQEVVDGLADLLSELNKFSTGDFGDVGDIASKGFETAERRGRGLLDVFQGLASTDFDRVTKGVAELTKPPPTKDAVGTLLDELQGLQKARVLAEEAFQPRLADALTKQIKILRDEIRALKTEGEGIPGTISQPLEQAIAELKKVRDIKIDLHADTTGIDRLIARLKAQIPVMQETARENARLTRGLDDLSTSGRNAAAGVDFLTTALKNLGTQSAAAQADLLRLQTEGGTPAQQIGVLQSDIEIQRQIIEDAKRRGGSGTATAIKKAREQIKSDQAEVDSLQAGIESDAKQAAAAAKTKADKIKTAREKATQAFIDAFDPKEQKRINAVTTAGLSEGLRDDINTNKRLIAFYKAEIEAIFKRIHDMDLHGDALKIAQKALAEIRQKIFTARNDIAKLSVEQATTVADAARSARETHLQALLSIAETTTRTSDDKKALEDIIRFDTEQIERLKKIRHRTQQQNAQLDAYRVDLAQRNKALRDIVGETKKNSLAQAEFAFLQTQQGFASNLLSNLIPGGATAGLVGGSQAAAAAIHPAGTDFSGGGFSGGGGGTIVDQIEGARTSGQAQGTRGVTTGQGSEQIHWLRIIATLLQKLNGGKDHPEAHHQRQVGAAIMDSGGGSSRGM